MSHNTLGGVPCPQYSTIIADLCRTCKRPVIAINDINVISRCNCLVPALDRRLQEKVETARIVEALAVQFDDQPTTQEANHG